MSARCHQLNIAYCFVLRRYFFFKRHFFFQANFYLIKFISVGNRTTPVSLEIYFFRCLKQFAISNSLVSTLLFILILIAHMWVRFRHMSSKCLGFWIFFMANRTNVLVDLALEIARDSRCFFWDFR